MGNCSSELPSGSAPMNLQITLTPLQDPHQGLCSVLGQCCNSSLSGGSCRGITLPSQSFTAVPVRLSTWRVCTTHALCHPEPILSVLSLWDTADSREGAWLFPTSVFNTVTSGPDPEIQWFPWCTPTFWPM